MTLDLKTVARALGGQVSSGQVLAPGPGHSANDRSLSIKLDTSAPDGFLVNSFANDDPRECKNYVRGKLGLAANDFQARKPRASNVDIDKAILAVAAAQSQPSEKNIVARYDYCGSDGQLLYQIIRLHPKDFRHRQPNGNGGWIWRGTEGRVLYRLPDLLKHPDATVFVCEGEKDADRVASLGHCATTVASGEWTDDCIKALTGRDCLILEDNDATGRNKALDAAQALHGVAKTIRIVRIPGLAEGEDVSDWLDANPRRTDKLVDICFDTPEWMPDQGDNATLKDEKPGEEPAPPLPFINIGAWHGQAVPERVWTVKDRIPGNNVTLLSGEGSIGKSILSLHLSTAIVLGKDWLQSLPDPGPALVACCEDDTSEIWRRLDLIFQHFGASYSEFKDLHVLALAGEDALMATPDRNGLMQPTKLFKRIHEAACDIKPRLVVLDNSADVFGGNENDRAQVRQFIGILRGMAIAAGSGVLLTSHPSLTGISSGTGLSGSTAWNASVRSRLYFKRAVTEKDEEPDPDLRVLEVMKTNYGRPGETITLKWKNGLFLPIGGISNLEKLAAEQRAKDTFLALLKRFSDQGRNVCEKLNAGNYGPMLFARENEARQLGIKRIDLETAMRNLFAEGKIRVEPYGPPSKAMTRLAIK